VSSGKCSLQYAVWGGPEIWAAVNASLFHSNGKQFLRDFHDALSLQLGNSNIYLLNGGRVALRVALQVMKNRSPGRSDVLVPAYVCPSVVRVVSDLGLTPVPVEIGPDLNLLQSDALNRLDRNTLAVVGVHMYACPLALYALESACRDAGVYLIDDAAHSMGAAKGSAPLGVRGDVGILSFNQSKTITTGVVEGGGALVINNNALCADFGAEARSIGQPAFSLLGIGKFLLEYQVADLTRVPFYYASRLGILAGARNENDVRQTRWLSSASCAIGLAQLRRVSTIRREKERVAARYHEMLRHAADVHMPQYAATRYLSRVMVQFSTPALRDGARARLRRAGIGDRLPYPDWTGLTITPHRAATRVYDHLLEVPSRIDLDDHAISRIAELLCLSEARTVRADN